MESSKNQQQSNQYQARDPNINYLVDNIPQLCADLQHGSTGTDYIKPASIQYTHPAPLDSKMYALREIHKTMVEDKISLSNDQAFMSKISDIFLGIKSCLMAQQLQQIQQGMSSNGNVAASMTSQNNNQVSDYVVEILLKANQVLFEFMPDIQNSLLIEQQMASMIPIFIENLGSPKAVVRKSTHKCIGTYVKLTKKLENVIANIIITGLENSNSRTRQHSMLVIPALLSLKVSIMERPCDEMKQLIKAVIRRIKGDQSEIVAKTGKKLILELNKCYPNTFKKQYIEGPTCDLDPVEKLICQSVLNNDDAMLKQAILNAQIQTDLQVSKKSQVKSQMVDKNDLRVVGKEILGNQNNIRISQSSEKEEPKTSKDIASNGLMYSFLKENLVEQLNENYSWKERTIAIETVEIELNKVLNSTDKKMNFAPHATQFMVFMIQYIKDINFKICLTAIQIVHKLLVLQIANPKKHYELLVTTLIEKLSDSKVIIRQAVLKCCSLLIKDNSPILFSHHATKYLQHTNWHVREGILHLVANCLIMQSQQFELNGGDREDSSLSTSPTLIQELVHLMKYESKNKIQQMSVDCLALSIDTSQNNTKTETMIKRELNSGTDNQNAQNNFNQIKDRQNEEQLPSMQIDGSIEFKPAEFSVPQYEQIPTFQEKPPVIAERVEKEKEQSSSSLNMRFQQDRLKNKPTIVAPSPSEIRRPTEIQQSQPKLKEQSVEKIKILDNTRQQYSLSTINHSENGHLQGITKESANPNMTQNNIPKVDTNINQKDFSGFAANNKKEEQINPVSQLKSATIPKTLNNEELQIHKQTDSDLKGQKTTNDEQKISMWLPSFQQSKGDSTKNVTSDSISGQLFDKRQNQVKSSATLINDQNRNNMVSPITPGSVVSSQNQTIGLKLQRNNHHEKPSLNVENQSQQAYIPGKHSYEPRQIQSNEVRQRTLENISFSQASPSPKNLNKLGGLNQKNDFISIQQSPLIPDNKSFKAGQVATNTVLSSSDIKQHQQRNMSQSSGAPGGFGVNKSQINERLQLLKSTFKYKNQSEAQEMQSQNIEEIKSLDNSVMQTKYKNQQLFPKANSEYNARGLSSQKAALNNNNYMLQTRSGDSVQDNQNMMGNAQQTHNSFGLSNVSTNINNTSNNYNIKSYSANKQLQSTTAGSGYNFASDRKDDSLNVYSNAQAKALNAQKSFSNSAAKGQFGGYGPVKATPIQQNEYMKTIQVEENTNNKQQNQVYQNSYGQNSSTNNTSRTRKPPINASGQKQNNATPQIPPYNRANSVTSNDAFPPNSSTIGGTSATHYNATEEPLANPEQQLKTAIENLKSTDWQKNFDAMNIIKRIAMFHKPLLSMSKDPVQMKECIKCLVKQTDNLRSQVTKNACMTISTIYSELPSKDLEPQIDLVMQPLLKKATDTNHFISDQADNALIIICHACNESKILNSLQSQNARSAVLKHKIAMCLTNIVSKLGAKIKTFRDSDKLIRFIVNMLSEGAQEVRNQAKLAILTCRNGLATAREFDGLMLKSGLNDKQIEQVRKIVEQGDYESLSNFANTRYGGSMRGSSMDSRGGIDQRRTPNVIPRGNGSDGFAQSTFSDGNKMQSTFMSGGIPTQYQQQISTGTANGFGMTGSSNTAFKKRQPSVSKPVDPQLMEDFKTMINSCNTHDWQKRLQSIDTVNTWINDHSITVKQTQPSKFIQLVDIYCKFLSDNNVKVQNKALVNFKDFLLNDNLRQLIDQNLTMIVQTMSHNLASTSSQVRNTSDQLLELLEQTTDNRGQLVQPIVAQINLSNNRSKSQLIDRLTSLIHNLQPSTQTNSIIDRYISPLLKQNNKIQNEASINPKLRESLKGLESAIMQVKTN